MSMCVCVCVCLCVWCVCVKSAVTIFQNSTSRTAKHKISGYFTEMSYVCYHCLRSSIKFYLIPLYESVQSRNHARPIRTFGAA